MSKSFTLPFNPLGWQASPHDFAGDNQLGPYQIEATKRYIPGTRYLMWDGRVFKYARATGTANIPYHLSGTIDAAADAWSTAVAATAGDRSIDVAMTGRSEDDLAGGYIEIYDSSIDNSVMRGIVGNDASGATNTTLYIDYPIAHTVTTSDSTEVFENPYIEVRNGEAYCAFLGLPASPVPTTLYYFWLQTYGPCIISGGGAALGKDSVNNKDVVADLNGALHEISTHENYQRIGYMINGTASPTGPLIMLQLSI